jgi:nicotinate phosphoribosyltransferase
VEWLKWQIESLGDLAFSEEEIMFLANKVPYLPSRFLDYLKTFKLSPRTQVILDYKQDSQDLSIRFKGLWIETILYEIPVLALISEAYFRFVDTDWFYDGQKDLAAYKCRQLIGAGCSFSEFGTRRRRSLEAQRIVIEGLVEAAKHSPMGNLFAGTSNVYFAFKYNLQPIGTVAHEWMMGIAAYTQEYTTANRKSMELWIATMGEKAAGYALTDTFGTDNFLKYFVPPFSDMYLGVRQDSGDPEEYTKLVGEHYEKLGYARDTKRIVYSDSLDVDKCKTYKAAAERNGLVPSFGVGTFFTNDFRSTKPPHSKSKPLNIVIKIAKINGHPAIKISDNLGKNTGDPQEVENVKRELGYTEREWSDGDESNRWR